MLTLSNPKLAVIGLGYVGLPLAIEFSKHFSVTGFDVDHKRIAELEKGYDATRELKRNDLFGLKNINYTSELKDIEDCTVYIVTVPTPVDDSKRPDLSAILEASRSVGKVLKKGDLVIYESTVYPGATEENCVPALESASGLNFNQDFFCGYSPERINPGDKTHRLPDIKKITSGSRPDVADAVDRLYSTIITAGTHRAPSIRVAEAAKVIENTQRDLNIALVNELAILFNKMGIDTSSVIDAASTKWNFVSFRPGLVGGHCIGVDPYYLTHKAQEIGYEPQVILAGRRINDSMGNYIATQMIQAMIGRNINIQSSRVLVLGLTFKENVSDLRNSRVIDVLNILKNYGVLADVHDPVADKKEAFDEYGVELCMEPRKSFYDAIILAVAHDCFIQLGSRNIKKYGVESHIFFDVKSVFDISESDLRL